MSYEPIPETQARYISHCIDDYPEVREAYGTRDDDSLIVYLVLSPVSSDRAAEIQQRLLKQIQRLDDILGYSHYWVNIWMGNDPCTPSDWDLLYCAKGEDE